MASPRPVFAALAVLSCLLCAQPTLATTWYVNDSVPSSGDGTAWEAAFKTIQEGINASSDGDTVIVAEGTYKENIGFRGKNIVLRSRGELGGTAICNTIIDGGGSGPVVTFSGTEDESCVLCGLTIQNGHSQEGGGICGGTSQNRSRATVRNNVIVNNSARFGGGIAHCDGLIENNTIRGNSAELRGGGVYDCDRTVQNCIIWGNTSPEYPQVCTPRVPTYSCIEHWRRGGKGNIEYPPYFVGSGIGAHRLRSRSPCIDAGDPSSDFSREPLPNGGRVDMGAFGNTLEATPASPDSDGDGLPDDWETEFFGDLSPGPGDDTDGDGRPNLQEYHHGTNPMQLTKLYVDASVAASGDGKSWATAFKTIQEAVRAAPRTDGAIVVAIGMYAGTVDFLGKNIALVSTDPLNPTVAAGTIIDGGKASPAVAFGGTEDETCILSGFTIQNGAARYGGGIAGNGTGALIQNNVIKANHAEYGGGVSGCSGTIRNNVITSNAADYGGGGIAGGGLILGNMIADNVAAWGGGIAGGGTIRGNIIKRNLAGGRTESVGWPPQFYYWDAEGGGVGGCDGLIENNVIVGNVAEPHAWGVSARGPGLYECGGTIQNNLLVGNAGSALRECHGTIQNNTIVLNAGCGIYNCHGTVRNCIIWDNGAPGASQIDSLIQPTYCYVQNWTGGGEGNISGYPGFVDPDGPDDNLQTYEDNNYRLRADSPCIDAGINFYWFAWPQDDLDGNCRLAGDRVDIGCYEYGSSLDSDGDLLPDERESAIGTDPNREDTDNDGLRDGLEVLRRSNPVARTAPTVIQVPSNVRTIQAALCLAGNGDELVVSPGIYHENLHFCGPDMVLRSTNPENPDMVASTVIDGNEQGPVVWFTGDESDACVLRGFTIRNGKTTNGGGVCGGMPNHRTHAAIENNVITQNYVSGVDLPRGAGGGIAFCDGTIRNNTVSHNTGLWDGGGIAYCDGNILNNLIVGNYGSDGGGIAYSHGTIANNTICDNEAYLHGGGLYWCYGAMLNNIIALNQVLDTSSWARGAGLSSCRGTIRNSLIWGNKAPEDSQVYDSYTLDSTILEDPLFIDADGPDDDAKTYEDNDYRLAPNSPGADAGISQRWMWSAVDLDGNPRVWRAAVDIGAYESGSFLFRVLGIAVTEGKTTLTWASRPGHIYTIESCANLDTGVWTLEASVPSLGGSTTWTGDETSASAKFYRVVVK